MDKALIIISEYLLDSFGKAQNGRAVLVSGGRIAAVGPRGKIVKSAGTNAEVIDLGRALLVPGLINCHNHLELTSLGTKVHRTRNFSDWLDEVRTLRDEMDFAALEESARLGVRQSVEYGVTTVVNHCNSGASRDALRDGKIRSVMAHELIAFDRATFEGRRPMWEERLRWPETEKFRHGLAPHAPYSVSHRLLEWARKIKSRRDCIMSIHLAEHKEEAELPIKGGGYFEEFLKHLRIPTDDFTPPGVGPVAYMHLLGLLGRRMICVHCNYISDDDIDTLRGDGATVCYCPRSHHYFYHENHPLTRLLKAGVNVALGTDSMVSNWTLSLLDEMKFVREHYAQIKTGTIFKMATSNGAIALAEDDRLGKIAEGYEADLAAISLSDGEEPALERALAAESKNIFTMIAGEVIFSTGR